MRPNQTRAQHTNPLMRYRLKVEHDEALRLSPRLSNRLRGVALNWFSDAPPYFLHRLVKVVGFRCIQMPPGPLPAIPSRQQATYGCWLYSQPSQQALGLTIAGSAYCSLILIFVVFKIRIVFRNTHLAAEQRAYMLAT